MSKNIVFLFSFLFIAICVNANAYIGEWQNDDSNTKGITKVRVTSVGTAIKVRAWGKCHPADCDWGTVDATVYYSDPGSSSVTAISAEFITNFSKTLLIITSANNKLNVSAFTKFTDNSGRNNYSAWYTFSKIIPRVLPAPKLLSPNDNQVFYHFPRKTVLTWEKIAGAQKYKVEVEYEDTAWRAYRNEEASYEEYVFNFVGAQRGRWRVTAIDSSGKLGTPSSWRIFTYTK